jgi:hypothetical protein
MRQIYLMNMLIVVSSNYFLTSFLKNFNVVDMGNNYENQFKYTHHVVMRGPIRDDMAIFIISHCPCLLSFDISLSGGYSSFYPQLTDHALQSIAEHCTGLQSLSLKYCKEITDTGVITISEHCTNLKSLHVYYSIHITDDSLISVSTYCTGLQLLNLSNCHQIKDASIISISTHCKGLKRCIFSYTAITDASLIGIAKNCTRLQHLNTDGCKGLSSDELRRSFKSISELRAVLLSMYPSHPI